MSDSVRPQNGSPPGSPVPGILQARTLEWAAISFSIFSHSPHLIYQHTSLTLLINIINNQARVLEWAATAFSKYLSVQFSSVAQSCPTLCDPMNRSTPGLPVHHQLPEFTQTHVHRVSDAIQPSHPLSSPSPPAPNHSQHHSLFQ